MVDLFNSNLTQLNIGYVPERSFSMQSHVQVLPLAVRAGGPAPIGLHPQQGGTRCHDGRKLLNWKLN